jgi:hypothetical protein
VLLAETADLALPVRPVPRAQVAAKDCKDLSVPKDLLGRSARLGRKDPPVPLGRLAWKDPKVPSARLASKALKVPSARLGRKDR